MLAHSDVAPGRKIDPGEKFDWERLFRNGIGHWVEPEPLEQRARLGPGDAGEAVMRLQAILAGYGYGIAVTGSYDDDDAQGDGCLPAPFPARAGRMACPTGRRCETRSG